MVRADAVPGDAVSVTYSCSVCGVKITMHRRIIGKPSHQCAKRLGRTYEMQATETNEAPS
jgi:hypothetical protein